MAENLQVSSMLILVAVIAVVSGQDSPVRTTTLGEITGFTTSADGQTVENYLGIPYAAPPTGDLRFRPPQPVQPWEGVWNASIFGNNCVQTNPDGPMSEDCLFLNVFVPHQDGRQVGIRDNMAVMIWIHGGAFRSGSGNTNGNWLAAVANVIVVTLNYRLHVFGFLSTGDQNSSGNYGLMDQRAAIVWVKENINNFGGDPDRMTIFGRSAGSMAASLQILSPKNNGLFSRVICESGVAIGPGVINYRPLESVRKLCNLLNCTTDDPAGMVSALRAADPVELTNAAITFTGSPPMRYWTPVIDGDFLPEEPLHMLEWGTLDDRELLLGSNNDEGGSLFRDPVFLSINDVEAAKSLIRRDFTNFITEDVLEASFYDYNMWNEEDPAVLRRAVADFDGDFTYVANTVQKANIYSKRNYTTYMYQFAHRMSYYSSYPDEVGATHGSNGNFIFPSSQFLGRATDDELNLMRVMMKFWSNFAKTGDPNSPTDAVLPTQWPPYLPSTKQYLRLTANMSTDSVLTNLRPKQTFFWTKTAPSLDGRMCECPACNTECPSCTPEVTSGAAVFARETLIACIIVILLSFSYNCFSDDA